MPNSVPFVDYYAILQVEPNCTGRELETAYHFLAKKYHPDHAENPDVGRFTEVVTAYRALSGDDKRSSYDLEFARQTGFIFGPRDGDLQDEKSPLSDSDAHSRILLSLYHRRRENALEPGIGRFYVQEMLGCSYELFEFHIWYLKEKGFLSVTEDGLLAITIAGVDHVIATSQTTLREKLMIAQAVRSAEAED